MRLRSARGASLIELAVALPLLVLVLVGTIDLARVFYVAIELTEAARAGAQYGAADITKSTDTTGMRNTAVAAGANIGVTFASTSALAHCYCVGNSPGSLSSFAAHSCTSSCTSASDHLVVNVTVTTQKTFSTITLFPGIPHSIDLTRSATLRVVN